ncbi:DUF5916 domain-containing protein [Fulvivirga sp.]|uniref:DUF5916 domain-containing protein n=1 Tax=Fulvivirga sp. TaxID=1931237 RepID=UPI0032EFE3DB
MNMLKTIFIAIFSYLAVGIQAQEIIPKKKYTTSFIENGLAPKIDGKLDEPSWEKVEWSGDYTEWSPEENTAPTEQTKLKILYDDKYLYVAFRCFDKDPKGVVRRLSRRDGFDGDWVEINIDSFHDLRTAFSFTISASGVRGEEFITNNGASWDNTWNPIWMAKTNVDDEGWTAEIKIPLSQLRFGKDTDQVWGIQSTRRYFRNEERSVWQRNPLNSPGWVSEFGELHGLDKLKPQRQMEIQPYIVASTKTYEAIEGDPYNDGRDNILSGGLDGKIGITNDLTLDFTVNPDFGQVEADPSAIALDGFQIFFQERRPFFIENNNIFDYKFSNSKAGNTFTFDNLFYSRRIGRSPQGFAPTASGEFVDQPDITNIIGATKFSGKTKDGWSIGLLESVTAEERANISNLSTERSEVVEPRTNYGVARIQKDFNNRNSFIGGIFTSTHRNISENVNFLHKSAYTGGLDFTHQWKNRAWYISGNVVMSQITGSKQAISSTQSSITHLFNRVDASHLSFDESLTSLTGTGGNFQLGKASGNWRFETGVTWRSPKLELNDLGFQLVSDDVRHYSWVSYRTTTPQEKVRSYQINYTHLFAQDFGGNLNEAAFGLNGWTNLNNNWWINGGVNYKPINISKSELRGGPRLRFSPELSLSNGLVSDSRDKLRFTLNYSYTTATDNSYYIFNLNGSITYQPTNALQISLLPSYTINEDKNQYVTESSFIGDPRYINAHISQRILQFPLRIDYIITPDISIQYWGQPYISRGTYKDFKYTTNSLAKVFEDRSSIYSSSQLFIQGGEYLIDEDQDGTNDYSFFEPAFSFIQWRSNMVLRWEYIPGSQLFLVWSQDITQFGNPQDELIYGLRSGISKTKPQDIFLIKLTYRFLK